MGKFGELKNDRDREQPHLRYVTRARSYQSDQMVEQWSVRLLRSDSFSCVYSLFRVLSRLGVVLPLHRLRPEVGTNTATRILRTMMRLTLPMVALSQTPTA